MDQFTLVFANLYLLEIGVRICYRNRYCSLLNAILYICSRDFQKMKPLFAKKKILKT